MSKEEQQVKDVKKNEADLVASTTIADVYKAAQQLEGVARHTELIHSEFFSEHSGCDVYLKPENLQHTGAFKLRGAYKRRSAKRGSSPPPPATMPKGWPMPPRSWGPRRSSACLPPRLSSK